MNRDHVAIAAAILVHAGLGVALAMAPLRSAGPPKTITVDVRKNRVAPPELPPPEPPKPEPPPPEPPKPAVKQKIKRPPEPAKAPPPNETKPPPEAPKPIPKFGVTMSSTTEGDSDFSVPVGNTTVADPKTAGKKGDVIPPLPTAPRVGPDFVPASPLDVSSEPEIVEDLLAATPYPDGEAKNNGIEGNSLLRIEVDEKGHVHSVKLVKSVGGGAAGAKLDKLAIQVAARFRFKPARDKHGTAVAYVIPSWTVTWVIEH